MDLLKKDGIYLGIDGCKGGWIAAIYEDGRLHVEKYVSVEEIFEKYPKFEDAFIDMVIGLPSSAAEIRPDTAARKIVTPQTSTIFSVPSRQAVYEETVEKQKAANRKALGKSLSIQTIEIIPKIRQLDRFLEEHRVYANAIKESHPEVCFARLNGAVLMSKKARHEGLVQRAAILENYLPQLTVQYVKERAKTLKCKADDIVDAIVLAVTANLNSQGLCETIPEHVMEDAKGLKMRMVIPAPRLHREKTKMDNRLIYEIAKKQSAIDLNCQSDDFEKEHNVIVASGISPEARRYLELPFVCNFVSYGKNIVASIDRKYEKIVRDYIDRYNVEHCFETPNMHVINDAFSAYGMRVCFMAEYFLPDMKVLTPLPCDYETRVLEQADFAGLYHEKWANALCEKRKHLDVLGVGAYDDGELVGLAACSADCDTMWQIGIDVLPAYRRKGIASALTSQLALEILKRDKVPFYCCAWSNIKSARNAIKSGFRPAWVEMTIKSKEFIDELNK